MGQGTISVPADTHPLQARQNRSGALQGLLLLSEARWVLLHAPIHRPLCRSQEGEPAGLGQTQRAAL